MVKTIFKISKWLKEKLLIFSIVAVIYFWGVWASLGLTLGYLVSRFFAGKNEKMEGRIPSLKIPLWKYRFHLHHWLAVGGAMIAVKIYGIFDLNSFFFWLGGGVVLQGILCYNNWHKVIYRKQDRRV
ncbi:MAG: hypothetical protein COV69_01865 [Parcubacteria group bacterium CG11_big_fil_rev_8_21_14_0_20_39_14]|nr:MAG: hypothetical protein COV69_01865 [Parcubacteria group bacterium CG11_big_fil_rev_8_21_14_0_20_39_14]PIS35550.1 MAG: hypothetical protein COT36_01790 [Parcubacteria group bacterium CG08_land_8_20_14_0_20_38_56]